MSDGEASTADDKLLKFMAALALDPKMAEPSPTPNLLFGNRTERLKPSAGTVTGRGGKMKIIRDNGYETNLKAIEDRVQARGENCNIAAQISSLTTAKRNRQT
jgi:hypothetical protein